MGITGASLILWKTSNISEKVLKVITDKYWLCNSNKRCFVDVGYNWAAFYLVHNKNMQEVTHTVYQFFISLVNIVFKVSSICVGNVSHHSKKDSIRRVTERRKYIINNFALYQTMLTISGERDAVVGAGRTTENLQKRKDDVILKYKI